jgi:hypothetical protein
MVDPLPNLMGPEVAWFSRLGRAMVVIGPLVIIGLIGTIVYCIGWRSPWAGVAAAASLAGILGFLEFN